MKYVYMTGYEVQGIKVLDQVLSLSFYKKSVTKPIDTQSYNIKGIYGMNGAGKSGIVTSVNILRKLLVNEDYLNNSVVQRSLEEIINKKTKQLSMAAEYLIDLGKNSKLYRYKILLKKSHSGKYIIGSESLYVKSAFSRRDEYECLISVENGDITYIRDKNEADFPGLFKEKTKNLLSTSTVSALFADKMLLSEGVDKNKADSLLLISFISLYLLGRRIFVYMDQSDDHTDYVVNRLIEFDRDEINGYESLNDDLKRLVVGINNNYLNEFSIGGNVIQKNLYKEYAAEVVKLQKFIKIFKHDLDRIDIDRKENGDAYVCSLIMVYDSYSINAEFESTGIKKLIRLFAYFAEMARGGIVFIDELDSNLHDVYLCALLEYLMEYGEGQLCFTTHNVGPMDILKQNKKSIDFLSTDHKIYPWIVNGNYSPSKLYRKGMIEGSPFNVESIDFIGIFDSLGEEAE